MSRLAQAAPPLAEAILPILLAAINDQSDAVCEALGQLVQAASHLAKPILPDLLTAVKDKNDAVRQKACLALGQLAQAAPPLAEATLSILLTAVKDKNDWVRQKACEALGRLAQAAPPLAGAILPSLLTAVKDQSDWVCGEACEALGQLAQVAPHLAKALLPNLLTAFKNENDSVREKACKALGWLCQGIAPPYFETILSELASHVDIRAVIHFSQHVKLPLSWLKQLLLPRAVTKKRAAFARFFAKQDSLPAPHLLCMLWVITLHKLTCNEVIYFLPMSKQIALLCSYEEKQLISIELTTREAAALRFLLQQMSSDPDKQVIKHDKNSSLDFSTLLNAYQDNNTVLLPSFVSAFHLDDNSNTQTIFFASFDGNALVETPLQQKTPTFEASLPLKPATQMIYQPSPIRSPANNQQQRFDQASHALLQLLQQWQITACLSIEDKKSFVITLAAEAITETEAKSWLEQCVQRIAETWKGAVIENSISFDSDLLLHSVKFETKTSQHAEKLLLSLQKTTLFTVSPVSANTRSSTH